MTALEPTVEPGRGESNKEVIEWEKPLKEQVSEVLSSGAKVPTCLWYFGSRFINRPLWVDESEKPCISRYLMQGCRAWKRKMDWILVPTGTLAGCSCAVHNPHNCTIMPYQGWEPASDQLNNGTFSTLAQSRVVNWGHVAGNRRKGGVWKDVGGLLFDGIIFTVKMENVGWVGVISLVGEAGLKDITVEKARGQTRTSQRLLSNVNAWQTCVGWKAGVAKS